jgi:hypothetical protein
MFICARSNGRYAGSNSKTLGRACSQPAEPKERLGEGFLAISNDYAFLERPLHSRQAN